MPAENHNKPSDSQLAKGQTSKASSSEVVCPDRAVSEHSSDYTRRITTLVNHAANQGKSLQSIIKLVNKETKKRLSLVMVALFIYSAKIENIWNSRI